jgi:putative hydrolase of the HAD superfamily/pyrimidine and pyridine-specific 5'-nucleotidase
VFFDDSARNIAAGKAAGFHTVIVSFSHCVRARSAILCGSMLTAGMAWNVCVQVGSSALVPGADVALESIHNIKEALPELWEAAAAGDHVEAVLRSAAVETTVIA